MLIIQIDERRHFNIEDKAANGRTEDSESKMTINGEFVKREIAGDIILVPTGETALRFNGMITLTESASVIWDALVKGSSRKEIIDQLLDEFEIDEETVNKDVDEFLTALKQNNFLVYPADESRN